MEKSVLNKLDKIDKNLKQKSRKSRNKNKNRGSKRSNIPSSFASNTTNPTRGIRVTHKEYVGKIIGSAGILSSKKPIQASNVNTFPLLSGIAQNFEKFTIHSLAAIYEPSSSVNRDGEVFLFFDYDAKDIDLSEDQIFNTDKAAVGPVYKPKKVRWMKDKDTLNKYYVQNPLDGAADVNQLSRFETPCVLWYGVSGSTPDVALGRVYIEIDIEFFVWDPSNRVQIVSNKTQKEAQPLVSLGGQAYRMKFPAPQEIQSSIQGLITELDDPLEAFGFKINKPISAYLNVLGDLTATGQSLGVFTDPALTIVGNSPTEKGYTYKLIRDWYNHSSMTGELSGSFWQQYRVFTNDPLGAIIQWDGNTLSSQTAPTTLTSNVYVDLATVQPNMVL